MFERQFAHWFQYFEDFPVSPLQVYKTLGEGLENRKVPDTDTGQVDFLERNLLSPKRVYLEVSRDELTYHICVAPFGTGFFVSSRLLYTPSIDGLLIIAVLLFFTSIVTFGLTQSSSHNLLVSLTTAFAVFVCLLVPSAILFIIWLMRSWRMTYYRIDSALAFQEAVHRLLIATVNQVVEAKGSKPLSLEQSKPVLHKLLQR